jgi:hypothetical protein
MSIVGSGFLENNKVVPIYWSNANAKPTTLPLLDDSSDVFATGINILGQIVGYQVNILDKKLYHLFGPHLIQNLLSCHYLMVQ